MKSERTFVSSMGSELTITSQATDGFSKLPKPKVNVCTTLDLPVTMKGRDKGPGGARLVNSLAASSTMKPGIPSPSSSVGLSAEFSLRRPGSRHSAEMRQGDYRQDLRPTARVGCVILCLPCGKTISNGEMGGEAALLGRDSPISRWKRQEPLTREGLELDYGGKEVFAPKNFV
jgi:hypothetical protein